VHPFSWRFRTIRGHIRHSGRYSQPKDSRSLVCCRSLPYRVAASVSFAGGVGDAFSQAMQLYARSKAWQKFGAEVWAGFKRAILPGAIGGGIGYQAGKRLSDLMQAP